MKKLTMLIAAMLISVSTLSITGCASNPIIETRVYIPDMAFPKFPDPTGFVELDEANEKVIMDLDYYARIYEYKARIDEVRNSYEREKELYTEKQK